MLLEAQLHALDTADAAGDHVLPRSPTLGAPTPVHTVVLPHTCPSLAPSLPTHLGAPACSVALLSHDVGKCSGELLLKIAKNAKNHYF
jgi:hypothetical protein